MMQDNSLKMKPWILRRSRSPRSKAAFGFGIFSVGGGHICLRHIDGRQTAHRVRGVTVEASVWGTLEMSKPQRAGKAASRSN